MDNLSMLNDVLHTEMMNQMQYNKYMMDIQSPEVRQMLMQKRWENAADNAAAAGDKGYNDGSIILKSEY